MRPESYTDVERCCTNCSYSVFDERDDCLHCRFGETKEDMRKWRIEKLKNEKISAHLLEFWSRCRVYGTGVCDEFEES